MLMIFMESRYSKISISQLILLFCLSPALFAAEDYRLTGVIGSDSGKAFAVIERADGQQQLLGEGEAIDNGFIESISTQSKTVILAFSERRVILSLTGSGMPDEYQEEFSIADYYGEVEQKSLDRATLSKLQDLSTQSGNIGEQELARRLNHLLGLSEQAHIAAYEQQEVDSTRDLIQQLATVLPERVKIGNHLGTIAVSDSSGRRRVYLQMTVD